MAAGNGVLSERTQGAVRCLLLDRPSCRNALDEHLVDDLLEAVEAPEGAAALVLGAAESGPFCAGADLSLADPARAEVSDRLYDLYRAMRRCPVPIIAALDGAAVGGGAQLAIACDLRVASPRAWLRFPGAGHGLVVGAWGLPSLIGRGRATNLCLTMRAVPADEALAIGLVDRLDDEPLDAAVAVGNDIAGLDAGAVTRLKRDIDAAVGLEGALRSEQAGNAVWSGRIPAAPGAVR